MATDVGAKKLDPQDQAARAETWRSLEGRFVPPAIHADAEVGLATAVRSMKDANIARTTFRALAALFGGYSIVHELDTVKLTIGATSAVTVTHTSNIKCITDDPDGVFAPGMQIWVGKMRDAGLFGDVCKGTPPQLHLHIPHTIGLSDILCRVIDTVLASHATPVQIDGARPYTLYNLIGLFQEEAGKDLVMQCISELRALCPALVNDGLGALQQEANIAVINACITSESQKGDELRKLCFAILALAHLKSHVVVCNAQMLWPEAKGELDAFRQRLQFRIGNALRDGKVHELYTGSPDHSDVVRIVPSHEQDAGTVSVVCIISQKRDERPVWQVTIFAKDSADPIALVELVLKLLALYAAVWGGREPIYKRSTPSWHTVELPRKSGWAITTVFEQPRDTADIKSHQRRNILQLGSVADDSGDIAAFLQPVTPSSTSVWYMGDYFGTDANIKEFSACDTLAVGNTLVMICFCMTPSLTSRTVQSQSGRKACKAFPVLSPLSWNPYRVISVMDGDRSDFDDDLAKKCLATIAKKRCAEEEQGGAMKQIRCDEEDVSHCSGTPDEQT